MTYQIMHEFTGYFIVSSHGHSRRSTVTYARADDDQWFDLDGVNPETKETCPVEVQFQEASVPPEWSGTGDPRDGRSEVVAVGAVYHTYDGPPAANFILDPEGTAWLKKNYPEDVSWLPPLKRSAADAKREDPVGWVLHNGGLDVDNALIAFLDAWYGWTSGEPDIDEIKHQIVKTVTAMVELAQCENAIGNALISFDPPLNERTEK
jgi:hypothetical protein